MRRSIIGWYIIGALTLLAATASGREPVHFAPILPTGNNATIMVPQSINPIIGGQLITAGDEIAVFDSTGTCVGAGVWEGENLALGVQGDDTTEFGQYGIMAGEPYRFRMWDSEQDQEYRATATYASGDSVYVPGELVVLATLLGDTPVAVETPDHPAAFRLLAVYPNPFNSMATVSFELDVADTVTLSVFTVTGQRIMRRELGYTAPGLHTVTVDAADLSSGAYLFHLTSGNKNATIRATLLK